MIATMTSMTFIGSASWLSDTCQSDGDFSAAIELGPCSASRRAASACVSPRSRSVLERGDDRVGVLGEPGSGVRWCPQCSWLRPYRPGDAVGAMTSGPRG